MSAPRFYTVELSGYVDVQSKRATITVSVLDRAYGYREVARYDESLTGALPSVYGATKAQLQAAPRTAAAAECARLNAEHEAWLAEATG